MVRLYRLLKLHYLQCYGGLSGLYRYLFGLVENTQTLAVQPFVVKNTCEIDLLAKLHTETVTNTYKPHTHQYLPVQMGFYIGYLAFGNAAPFHQFLFVVDIHRLHSVEQHYELGVGIALPRGV